MLKNLTNSVQHIFSNADSENSFDNSLNEVCCNHNIESLIIFRVKNLSESVNSGLCFFNGYSLVKPELIVKLSKKPSLVVNEHTKEWFSKWESGEHLQIDFNNYKYKKNSEFGSLEFNSMLGIPMVLNGRFWGVILFIHHEKTYRWEPEEISILRSLSDIFAIFPQMICYSSVIH